MLDRTGPRVRASSEANKAAEGLKLSLSSNIVGDSASGEGSVKSDKGPVPTRAFTEDLREHPSYRPDIDGLRAVAIIPVVIFHAFPTLLPGGFIGVDIFFVISGFLISSIIFKGLERKSFSFSSFYANRIKRIFPALLVVLIVSVVIGWFFLLPGEYERLGGHVAGGAGYAENLVLWREAGYFDTRTILKPLMHLWSLGIEEQFYLTYPFLLWAAWRLRRNLLAVLVPLICISFAVNVWEMSRDAAAGFFLPQTRFWELWSGGILAYLDLFGPYVRRRCADGSVRLTHRFSEQEPSAGVWIVPEVLSVGGALLIGVALVLVRERAFPGWWALLPVGGASLLILAGPSAWINRKILSNRAAVFIGLISYPLYLWHWPILSFGRIIRGEELPSGVRIAAVLVSLLLAWATWRFVESPIRFGRKTWVKTAALVAVSVAIGSLGYTIHSEDGFANRFRNIPGDFDWAHPEKESTPDCREKLAPIKMDYCRSSGAGTPDVLLIGDSHAGAVYRGLAQAYDRRSEIVMNLAVAACVPFYDTETYTLGVPRGRDCRPLVNRMLDFAISSPTVRTIILSMRGPKYVTGLDFGDAATLPPKIIAPDGAAENSSRDALFASALRNTVARLSASGKNVVLFEDWPELGFDPRTCLPRPVPLFSRVRSLCGVPRAQVDARNQAYREIVSEVQKEFSRLVVFDPLPYLCDSNACYAMREGHLLYRDENHLSAAGSAYLAEKFLAEQDRQVSNP
jgi:peptidoglycan/LPS O-acetylase OafA/YrhL